MTPASAPALQPEELRGLFLFESLSDRQLTWLAEHGTVRDVPARTAVFVEGEPATEFFVLLEGTLAMYRRVGRDEVEVTRTDQRGVYAGATQAYLENRIRQQYLASLRTISDCRFFVLPAAVFATMLRRWFPMGTHLLEGLFLGQRITEVVVGQRERLVALGSLAAGLTHELNNPASAAVRAAQALRERVAGMRHKLTALARGDIDPGQLGQLTTLQEQAVAHAAQAPTLTALQAGDREDELTEWLAGQGVPGAADLAVIYTAAGLDQDWLEDVATTIDEPCLGDALRWLGYTLETEALMREIQDAVTRISSLVAAAAQYSQVDRSPHQLVDVHEGLDSTLVMLTRKLGDGVRVVRDYDRDLPALPAYPAELNQVWTNLIDNAVAAMGGHGVLTLRTRRDGDHVLVEVGDTGPGVPPELHQRIFEPFFTTKPVGEGTGLGLDIAFRIVVDRHGGDLRVKSVPGDTRFQARLPLHETTTVTAPGPR